MDSAASPETCYNIFHKLRDVYLKLSGFNSQNYKKLLIEEIRRETIDFFLSGKRDYHTLNDFI